MEEVTGSEEDTSETKLQKILSGKMKKFNKLNIFTSAQLLLSADKMGKLTVVDDTLEEIRQINAPLSIVGICGPYRSGKSFLANYIMGEKCVFEIGHSTDSQTKGIWVKCIRHPTQRDQILMVLDTEGFGDAKKTHVNDNCLFTITFLLSSTLIYNTFGVVNMDLLDRLKIITKLPNHCQMIENADKADSEELLPFVSPTFVLCLRDFYLQLPKDCQNPDDYFESFLKDHLDPGNGDYNKARQCIRTYFPVRRCFVVGRPAADEKLNKLNTLDEHEYEHKFKENMTELKEYVLRRPFKCLAKMIKFEQKPIDGLVFGSLVITFAQELQTHRQICFDRAFANAAEKHNSRVVERVLCKIKEQVDEIEKSLPKIDEKELLKEANEIKRSSLYQYRRLSYPYHPDIFERTLVDEITKKYEELYMENRRQIFLTCTKGLTKIHEELMLEKKNKDTDDPDPIPAQRDIEQIEQTYRKRTLSVLCFEEREEALTQFKQNLNADLGARKEKNKAISLSGTEAIATERKQFLKDARKDAHYYYKNILRECKEQVPENEALEKKMDDWWCSIL
ncbi:guanylate-binding protein 1-like [Mercenaria mercenaria]|uniref:guanylate-binding protein 1-like n=1 Tax=Mercenaria mercenaria TaxID=6596 RepID=UPI00234FB545|nr:guanylate-binding protein 1-like [Mercenaria mercenaria]